MSWRERLSRIVAATAAKLKEQEARERCSCSTSCSCANPIQEGELDREYKELEGVGPAPWDTWGQHEAMVQGGLCRAAAAHPNSNRSTLFVMTPQLNIKQISLTGRC